MSGEPRVDLSAEFTLRVSALAQTVLPGAEWPRRWHFLPQIKGLSWEEAREFLVQAPKPVVVTPLADPSYLGVWPTAPGDVPVADHIRNQVAFYDEKIPRLALRDEDTLV